MKDLDDYDPGAGAYSDVPEDDGPGVVPYVDVPPVEQVWPGRTRRASDYGHTRYVYQQLRARFKRICESENRVCVHCGGEIDYTSPHGGPLTFEVDHRVAVSDDAALELDVTGWDPAHALCNRRRGRGEGVSPTAVAVAPGAPTQRGAGGEDGAGLYGQPPAGLEDWQVAAWNQGLGVPSERW